MSLTAVQQGDEIDYNHDDFVCNPANSTASRVELCVAVIFLLRRFTVQQFREQKPRLQYSDEYDRNCIPKNVVYQYLENDTLKSVPMFFCSKYFLFFATSKRFAITTDFYVRQGEVPKELLVFIDLPFSRKSESFTYLENSVRLWHVAVIPDEDQDQEPHEGKAPKVVYERQLSAKLGITSGNEITNEEKKEVIYRKQLSRKLSRQMSAELSITKNKSSDEVGTSSQQSPEIDEKKSV